jgi:hypothetical protein
MYTKHESSQLRQTFWTVFGQYMSLHLSAEGEKINWINYKTGIKNIYFKLHADSKKAFIAIEITHDEPVFRRKYYEQFLQSKKILRQFLNEDWYWQFEITAENGKVISRIFIQVEPVSIFNKEDWPHIISFLKPRLVALDQFWSLARYGFEHL